MWGNLKSFFSGNPSMNLVLATWNNQGPGSSRVRAENSLIGFAAGAYSYGRGVARGIDAIVDLTGIKGEEAQAEQQQAIKDITGAGRLAVEHPRAAWQITKHVVHWESQRHPERMAGRMLTGIAAGTIAIPVGKAAIPLNAVLTPLAIFGDATHNAIEVRRRAESYGMGHLLDSVLTGGSNHGDH